ncbi:MAG: hypothetical protein AAF108_03140 [Planctomycetota bacterium]
MHRDNADPANMQPQDFVCDFSLKPWDGTFPMVEGHRGSLISGDCLSVAYRRVVLSGETDTPPSYTCTMCLEERTQNAWQSPVCADAVICERCIRQSATRLHKDPDWDWSKPNA